jgi:hypothetical protein
VSSLRPNAYVNGTPYDFESKDLLQTANANSELEDRKPNKLGVFDMKVMSPGGLFNTGMCNSSSSVVIKELRNTHNNPDACAGCGADSSDGGKARSLLEW